MQSVRTTFRGFAMDFPGRRALLAAWGARALGAELPKGRSLVEELLADRRLAAEAE
jgi:hypothetical protein